jgi:ATP-dependent Lon protease
VTPVAESERNQATAGSEANTALRPLPPDAVIVMSVRDTVLFPGMVAPITVGRPRSVAAAQQAVREQRQIGILMQRDGKVADPEPIDMHRMGTIANIIRYITTPDGVHHVVCQGDQRFQVTEFLTGWPFLVARVLRIPESEARSPQIEARFLNLKAQAVEAIQLLPQVPAELLAAVQSIDAPPADQGRARRASARGVAARADGGNPAPAWRRRRGQGR